MEMQHPEVVSQLDKIKEVTLAEVVEAASFQQREDRDAFLERALASPRHPEQVVDLEAVRQDRKLVDFLRDVVAAIEAADQGAGSR